MLADSNKTAALGLEYFCTEGDELWNTKDEDLISLAITELEKTGLGKKSEFENGFVARVSKTYPVYDAAYPANIKIIRDYLKDFGNL